MKRILISCLLSLILVSNSSLHVFAEVKVTENPNFKIIIDGKLRTYSNVPIIVNGRTLLPLRELLVNLGVQNDNDHIIWKGAENSIEIKKDGTDICLKVGAINATVNGIITKLDAAPVNYKSRIYIPAGFIAQSIGKAIFWDSTLSSVHIITPSMGPVSIDRQRESSIYASWAYDLEDKQGKPKEAIICYDIAIALDPLNDQAYYWKGLSLEYNENFEEAIKCFEGAIEANPNNSNAYNEKGMILYKKYKYSEALECFSNAIEVNKDGLNIETYYYNKGNALYFLERPEEASVCYEKAIQLAENYIYPYLGNGYALLKSKRYGESIEYFDKCIERSFCLEDAYLGKGQALFFLNMYDDAITCYDEVIEIISQRELNINDGLVYLYKGDALVKLNKITEAKQCYDIAIEINPELRGSVSQ